MLWKSDCKVLSFLFLFEQYHGQVLCILLLTALEENWTKEVFRFCLRPLVRS